MSDERGKLGGQPEHRDIGEPKMARTDGGGEAVWHILGDPMHDRCSRDS